MKTCKICGSRMLKIVSFSGDTIRQYYKCESCKLESEHSIFSRNGMGIQEFMRKEVINNYRR